jgi:hypothetical protein
MFVSDNPEASLDDVLAHYGVMGMKWGQRKQADAHDIRAARFRLQAKSEQYRQLQKKVNKTPRGSAQRTAGKAKLHQQKVSFLKNPDRVVATRMTRGEKAVALLLTLPVGGVAGVAAIGATSAISRRIEYKQQNGGYNNK